MDMNKLTASQGHITKTRRRGIASLVTLAALLVLMIVVNILIAQGLVNARIMDILKFIGINVIAAVSLNMVTGLMGQLVLGHAGFMLVGAYAASMFMNAAAGWATGPALAVGLLLAGLISALFGILIGVPALRLRGDYLAIITLGFGEIIKTVALTVKFTNGAKNYYGYPTFSGKTEPAALFNFIFILMIFVIFFSYTFGTSRQGRAVLAIREDEIAAESCGINTTYYKLLTFALSAFFAGIAGGLLAQQLGLVAPTTYGFNKSIDVLMMVVLGGMGSITGSVLSASVLTLLPELLRGFAEYRMLIYSVVLIIVMLFRPKGLLGRAELRVLPLYEKVLRPLFRAKRAAKGGERL